MNDGPVDASVPLRVPPARLVFSDSDRRKILGFIDDSLQSGSLTLGPRTADFEARCAELHGVQHAVATASGTSAIEIILRTIGVSGTEVVVPANTFYATAGAAVHAGGSPRFADVSPTTFALTPESVESAITSRTSAVVLVHIGGVITPDAPAIRRVCDAHGVALVEDAAHAHGSELDGRRAGSFGAAAALSFYPTKVVTSAEGGMILTDDERIAAESRIYRDQGKAGFFGGEHVRMGYAWRLSELQAAVGLVQIDRLDEFVAHRRAVARHFDERLADVPGITPLRPASSVASNYYKYIAMLDHGIDRNQLKQALRADYGVGMSGEVYARPLHVEPVFAELADTPLPVAEDVCARHVCLPIFSDMTGEEIEIVVESLAGVLAQIH